MTDDTKTAPRRVPLDDDDKTKATTPRRGRVTKSDKIRSSLTDLYNMIGMGALTVDPIYGQYVMDQSDAMADAWMEVAESNPKVMGFLTRFTEGAGIGTLVMAHIMLAAPLLARRGIVPAPVGIGAMAQSKWVQDNGGGEFAAAYVMGAFAGTPDTGADQNGNGGGAS